jgi:site-specific recombinase XerD
MPPTGKGRPRRRLPPEILTDGEVCRLLDACDGRSATGVRNQALIAVLYRAGLRISEALHLWPKDIDLESGSIRVLRGKGGRARTVGIDPIAGGMVGRWLAVRDELGLGSGQPVFCTLAGARMGDAYVRVLLPRLARKAGIDKRVHAHGLRHTHAAQLRAEGVDIGIISKQLGHRSIATTARYLDHIAPQQVIEAIRRRPWQSLVSAVS